MLSLTPWLTLSALPLGAHADPGELEALRGVRVVGRFDTVLEKACTLQRAGEEPLRHSAELAPCLATRALSAKLRGVPEGGGDWEPMELYPNVISELQTSAEAVPWGNRDSADTPALADLLDGYGAELTVTPLSAALNATQDAFAPDVVGEWVVLTPTYDATLVPLSCEVILSAVEVSIVDFDAPAVVVLQGGQQVVVWGFNDGVPLTSPMVAASSGSWWNQPEGCHSALVDPEPVVKTLQALLPANKSR